MIREEIGKCLEITDNLLKLSAPSGDGQALVELGHVIDGVTALLSYEAERRSQAIHTEVEPGLRLLISDSDLRMLLTNLVMNSFHAMSAGGVVTIRATRQLQSKRIALQVEDTGGGIAPEDIDRIFLPFWTRRGDGSSGRGLGLAIVRTILDRHGADVRVDSRKGKGTIFTLLFPDPDNESKT